MSPDATPLNPRYGPEETVPELECSYGSLTYAYSAPPYEAARDEAAQRSRLDGCHTPVGTPAERRHCGGVIACP